MSIRASRSSGEFWPWATGHLAPKQELESVGSPCLSISLMREASSWAKARLA